MKPRLLFILTLLSVLAISATAADITGKWVAQVPGREGQTREQVYNFKADGSALTGTMSGFQGNEIPISEGKIDGDKISFTAKVEFNGNAITWNFTGTVSGDEIKMKREGGRGPSEFVAKRAK